MRHVVITSLALLLASPAALGQAKKGGPLIMLPLQGQCTIKTLDKELADAMSEVGRKVSPSSLGLDDMKMAVGCVGDENDVECLAKMGQSIKAGGLVLGKVSQTGNAARLQLRWFDVGANKLAGSTDAVLPLDPMVRKAALLGAVRSLFGVKAPVTTPSDKTGGLAITSNQPYVEITINGQARGALPLELRDLEPMTYVILARLDGYLSWRGDVVVAPGRMTRVNIEMIPSPQGKKAPTFFAAVRWPTWLVFGVGVAAMGGGVAFGSHMWSAQNDMDDLKGDTIDELKRMEELRETGQRDALAANILFGIGAGALLTSGFMAYWDYRRNREAAQPAGSDVAPAPASTRVLVGPGSIMLRGSF